MTTRNSERKDTYYIVFMYNITDPIYIKVTLACPASHRVITIKTNVDS